MSLLYLFLRALLGRALTTMLGRACRRRVNEVQVMCHHYVYHDRDFNSVNM